MTSRFRLMLAQIHVLLLDPDSDLRAARAHHSRARM
jgi:hypothetical protein